MGTKARSIPHLFDRIGVASPEDVVKRVNGYLGPVVLLLQTGEGLRYPRTPAAPAGLSLAGLVHRPPQR